MRKKKLKKKVLALSLGLGAAMLLTPTVQAQGVFGDMLDNYYAEKEQSSQGGGALLRGSSDRGMTNNYISNDDFGDQPAPLGSGIAIMLGAGLGYVALKKKED